MRVCVTVPTTDGPAPILRLTRLVQAPRSVMRTQDDYRPLPPSGRYHAFVQTGGALANRMGYGAAQFELRLGKVVETGRSWELPAAIAHWLQAEGHELDADTPDLLVWATGALDNDLHLLPQDYHLERKLHQSVACLQKVLKDGIRVLLILPESIALPPELQFPNLELHIVDDLAAAVEVLQDGLYFPGVRSASYPLQSETNPRRSRMVTRTFAVLSILLGLITLFSFTAGNWGVNLQEGSEAGLVEPGPTEIDIADVKISEVVPISAVSAGPSQEGQDLPTLVLEYAPVGGNCQAVLFGSRTPERRDLLPEAGAYPAIRLTGLCGIGFRLSEAASTSVEVMLPLDLSVLVLPSDLRPRLQLQSGETQMLRLRATLPDALDMQIGLLMTGEKAKFLGLAAVR